MIFHSLHNVSIIICVLFSFYCFKFLTFSGFKVVEIHKYCSTVCPTIVFHYSFEDYIVCSLFHYSFEDYNVPLISLQFWRLQCAPCFISFEDYSVSFLAHLAKGHVSFCHHLRSSSVRLSYIVNFHILIFSSETTGPIATKLCWNGPWMAHFQNLSGDPDFQPRWPPS